MWKLKARKNILTLGIITSLLAPAPLAAEEAAWDLLYSVKITEVVEGDTWRAEKTFPDDLAKVQDGFEIEGYVVPVIAQPDLSVFLMVEYPADCPFCGGGGYGPGLEVHMRNPLPDLPEFAPLRVRGYLALIDDPETFQAFCLKDAVPIEGAAVQRH